ncbi:hypothetical protein MACH15_24370 [Maricaulis maris]|nr:hypothetical protein MACH15_24370 [Maricaulis maris]
MNEMNPRGKQTIFAEMVFHPLPMSEIGFDCYRFNIVNLAPLSHSCEGGGRPSPPARTQLDEPINAFRARHALEHRNPVKIVLIQYRQLGAESFARFRREPGPALLEANLGPDPEEIIDARTISFDVDDIKF